MAIRCWLCTAAAGCMVFLSSMAALAQSEERSQRGSQRRGPEQADFQRRQLQGEIVAIKKVPIRQTDVAHVVAQLESDRGDRTLIDFGPASNLREVRLARGDRISVSGRVAQVGDFRIVIAQQVQADGKSVSIAFPHSIERSGRGTIESGSYSDSGRPPARTVSVVAEGFEFEPAEIRARPGEKLRIELVNESRAEHNIEFELPSGEVELDQNVAPGRAASLTLKVPAAPGSYTFYCPVGNHRQKGMQGKLIVGEFQSARRRSD